MTEKYVAWSIRLPGQLLDQFKELAEAERRTTSAELRYVMERAIQARRRRERRIEDVRDPRRAR